MERDGLTERIREYLVQSPRLQSYGIRTVRWLRRSRARAWSAYRSVTGLGGAVDNVYVATVQKTGSQWLTAVLQDPLVRKRSGLAVYPGHRYEWDEFHSKFPRYLFVPGLYISHGLYEEIRKPDSYRTVYVLRDPRDVVVSWYYSMRFSHRLMGKVSKHRRKLRAMNKREGLTYAIKALCLKMTYIRTWLYASDDPRILFVRFEDLVENPVAGFTEIFEHCRVPIEEEAARVLAGRYTKERMRERDRRRSALTQRSSSGMPHYREGGSDWRVEFETEHHDLFNQVNGDLLSLAGYA